MAIFDKIKNAQKINAERYGKKGSSKELDDLEMEDIPEAAIEISIEKENAPMDVSDKEVKDDALAKDTTDEPAVESPKEEMSEKEKSLMEALLSEREKYSALEAEFNAWKESSAPLGEDTLNHQDAMMRELYGDEYGSAMDHFHEMIEGDTDGIELEALRGAPYPAIYAYKKGKDRMTAKQAEAEAAKQAEREQMRMEIMAELEAKKASEAPTKVVKKEESVKIIPAPAPTIPQGYGKSNAPQEKPSNIFSMVKNAQLKRKGA